MLHQIKNPRLYLMLLSDIILFIAAHVGAYLLRFEFVLSDSNIEHIGIVLLCLLPLKVIIFHIMGLYRGMWRYSGIEDLRRLAQASLFSMVFSVFIIVYGYGFSGFSRSVFFLDGILTFLLTGGLRMGIRFCFTMKNNSKGIPPFYGSQRKHSFNESTKDILIIGAGDSGEKLLREISDNPTLHYRVIGFLDDDPKKRGRTLHGVPVLGAVESLPRILDKNDVRQVLISIPSATGTEMRRIVETCKACKIPYKTLPALSEIVNGRVSLQSLRDVNYEDLLRRPPVTLDTVGIEDYLAGRCVLVTGAGGSIGSELCRQLIRFRPEQLILMDGGEANLFHIQMELLHEKGYRACRCILGRVQHRALMEEVFKEYQPQVVFHAAAYKHVPMLEQNPWEAVFNNVLGSQVAMETALKYHADRFVLVSTDKAVRPTNVMGTTKRITELILQSLQGNGTRFMAVRFGNVVGSSGSVIPLFRRQIEQGGPVTVTHPDVTRYFMTIPEAAQLILQAGAIGAGGEIFILEMGTPVKIADMARDLIRLSGKEPDEDIEVIFTGLREGEKLYEELITLGENITGTKHKKIMTLRSNGYWNGLKNQDSFRRWLDRELKTLYSIAEGHDASAIKRKLNQLVPEYMPQETGSVLRNGKSVQGEAEPLARAQ